MPTKLQLLSKLAEETAKRITGSLADWTDFLTTVGRLYRYNYHEQLMIYAQRPNATACAEYDLWNNKMNRYVRRGSKGIALIDPTGDIPRLKYVFDVSDTGGRENSRLPYLWNMQEYHKEPILEMLKDKFYAEDNNLSDAFYNIARNMSKEYYDNHKIDIRHLIENSFLEEYDEDNIRKAFEDAATVSTAYTLMKRCGLDTEEYFTHEDFLSIFDFNTADTVALLGTAVSEQSEQIFRQIAITIIKIERERSMEYERNHLQKERGLSDTQHHIDTTGRQRGTESIGQIRQNEETISSGTQETIISFPAPIGETVSSSVRNQPSSQQEDGADYDGLTESTDPARQDETSDGMGGLHEQSESTGGGNDIDGTYIQLSLFPTEQEQIQRITENLKVDKPLSHSVFSMSQKMIDRILRTGSNRNNGLLRIVSFYQKDKSIEEKVDLLQKEYQGGKGLLIDGQKISIWFHTDGIHIAKGETALYSRSKEVISWTDVAERIEELLNDGQYVTQDILDDAAGFERQQLAERFWYLHQDFSDKARDQFFDEEIFKGGFPSSTNHIAQLLDDPKEREMIIDSLQRFNSAYEQDPTILRFHFHKPQRLLSDLMELDLPRREFSSTLTNMDDFIMFITQDEVDKELTSGSGVQSGKYRIFDYFTQSHSPKEKEDFLKQEYGIGGRSHALSGADNSNQMHDAKGILYSRRDNDDKLLLNWSKVAKRIDYLISVDHYMTTEEKERFEELQQENVGIEETPPAPSLTDESINSTTIHQSQDELIESEELAEINIIPFEKGDTIYLENGTPFLIEEITDYHVILRDPSLLYPILRSESRESFLRLLEHYPQSQVPQEKAENYRITDEHLGEGSKRDKFAGNVAAITTLQTIEKERRPATKEEQEILSHYVGWGGLSEVFDKDNSSFGNEYAQLKSLLSEDEYSMARASTLNAHYTSPTVIKAIYDAVEGLGFTTGNILDIIIQRLIQFNYPFKYSA